MKKFTIREITPEHFGKKVRRALKKGPLGEVVKFEVRGQEIEVIFNKLGQSKIVYNLATTGDGFEATHKSENIIFTHTMFRREVEKNLRHIMSRLGARVE